MKRLAIYFCTAMLAATLGTASLSAGAPRLPAIPPGTAIEIRLDEAVSSKQPAGRSFQTTVLSPVVVHGKTVIPRGARAMGQIVDVKEAGHLMGAPRLALRLESVAVKGKTLSVDSSTYTQVGRTHPVRNFFLLGVGKRDILLPAQTRLTFLLQKPARRPAA